MNLVAIDPGPTHSHLVYFEDGKPIAWESELNLALLDPQFWKDCVLNGFTHVVFEQVACYGMPVGEPIFETVFWTGRLVQQASMYGLSYQRIPRLEVKLHLCHTARANDATIRQALKDKYGEPGTKKNPGKLYGMKSDQWQALALGVTYIEKHKAKLRSKNGKDLDYSKVIKSSRPLCLASRRT